MVTESKSTKCKLEEDRNNSELPETINEIIHQKMTDGSYFTYISDMDSAKTIDEALTHNGNYPEIIDESYIKNKIKENDPVKRWYLTPIQPDYKTIIKKYMNFIDKEEESTFINRVMKSDDFTEDEKEAIKRISYEICD